MVLHENICQGLSMLNSGGGRGYSQNHHNDRVKFYAKIVWLKQRREENIHDVWKKKTLMIWQKILSLSLPLVHLDENPFQCSLYRYVGTSDHKLTAGQKTRTDSACVRRVSLRRSLLKGLAEIPFMVSWLEGNNVMGKGATSDSTECSPEGTDEQGWFERMGRSKYVFHYVW